MAVNLNNTMDDTDLEMATPAGSSSFGEAVSGRGQSVSGEEEDEDLYYIPERRPSLDLGPSPMDTSQWYWDFFHLLARGVLSYTAGL